LNDDIDVFGETQISEAVLIGAMGSSPWLSKKLVAGGRYELYNNYALEIQAVAASITAMP